MQGSYLKGSCVEGSYSQGFTFRDVTLRGLTFIGLTFRGLTARDLMFMGSFIHIPLSPGELLWKVLTVTSFSTCKQLI